MGTFWANSTVTSGTAPVFAPEDIPQESDFRQSHMVRLFLAPGLTTGEGTTPPSFQSDLWVSSGRVGVNLRKFKDALRYDVVLFEEGRQTRTVIFKGATEGPARNTWTVPSWRSEWMSSWPSERLNMLLEKIAASRKILAWSDNWDGEGSPGYKELTWKRSIRFIQDHIHWLWRKYALVIDAPDILPGPDGSIDIHWETKNYELLINIPADPSEPASFYGDDYGNSSIRGTFKPESYNLGLLSWLLEH